MPTNKDPLHDWPYAWRTLEETLDPVLIEKHGLLHLYRSLNIGNTIAFIGSGTSLAYGRLSWSNLVEHQVALVSDKLQEFEKSVASDSAKKAIKPLRTTFESLKNSDHPDSFPVVFQIGEQLFQAISEQQNVFRKKSSSESTKTSIGSGQKDTSGDAFQTSTRLTEHYREHARRLTYDDREFCLNLLRVAKYGYDPSIAQRDEFHKEWNETDAHEYSKRHLSRSLPKRDQTEYYSYLHPFASDEFFRLSKNRLSRLNTNRDLWLETSECIHKNFAHDDSDSYVTPTHRFMVAALLCLEDEPSVVPRHREMLKPLSSRSIQIDPELDPLNTILLDLRISRFLTTNYDLELERLLLHRGYRLSPDERLGSDDFRADRLDPIGGQARDMTFNAANAAEVVVMAAQQSATDAFVVHLHGRSTTDSDVVVTERDYMDLYLRRDDARDLIDESITIGFSANPILFVGLGLGEADLMRPLRQFMSDQENRRNRTAVALVPIEDNYDRSITERVTLFMRYGVHVVHYGCTTYDEQSDNPFPWLGLIKVIIRTAGKLVKAVSAGENANAHLGELKLKIRQGNEWNTALSNQDRNSQKLQVFTPASIDGEDTNEKIRAYIALLNTLLLEVLTQSEKLNPKDCIFSRMMFEGLETAITTAVLCCRLNGIESGWREWWQDWQKPLIRREAALSQLNFDASHSHDNSDDKHQRHRPPFLSRHRLQLKKTASSSDSEKTDSEPTISRIHQVDSSLKSSTFRQFKEAVASLRIHQNHERTTLRRIFVIAAARGMGKGHFFSEFQDSHNELEFINMSWADGCHPEYSPSIFINLSFSSEVASVWDGLIRALENNWIESDKPNRYRRESENEMASTLPRPVRLRRALRLQSECHGKRVLIAVNAIDLLFKSDGKAKNTEVRRIFRELCGQRSIDLPFDLVVVGNEHRLPKIFREDRSLSDNVKDSVRNLPHFLVFKGATETASDPVERRCRSSQIRVADTRSADYANFVQFPEPFRAIDFFLDRFPRLAMLFVLDWNAGFRRSPGKNAGLTVCKNDTDESILAFDFKSGNAFEIPSDFQVPPLYEEIKNFFANPSKGNKIDKSATTDSETPFIDLSDPDFYSILRKNYDESTNDRRVRQWDDLLRAFNNNRFILTVLLRAADYMAEQAIKQLPVESTGQPKRIDDVVEPVDTFMIDTMLHALAASTGRREEVVLSDVLDCYERYHEQGNPDLDILLHLALLRHLAVIGQPTSADVLARAPELRKYLDEYYNVRDPSDSDSDSGDGVEIIEAGLNALTDRCLAFRIVPVTVEIPNTANPRSRYTLHRLTQRHVFRKMDGPLVEFAETNEYAVSLYAAQASDLPRPTIEAYRFLRDLVNGLTDYPERSPWIDGYTPASIAKFSVNESTELSIRSLRAAIGVIRSIFSIAVVSRFREYDDFVDVPSKPGYLAEHRLQIRWLLKRALDLDYDVATRENEHERKPEDLGEKIYAPGNDATETLSRRNERTDAPFYLDEIVWLYNECGVTALVQGNMSDSVALLRQALEINVKAEGRIGYGAHGARIAVNLSIAQIERANIRSAERRLKEVYSIDGEDEIVRAIAQGYLGLIRQLSGSHAAAAEKYDGALKVLVANNHMRAASIFIRHWGDSLVLSSPSESGVQEGINYIKQAVAYAQTGGHEDMRQVARLALIRARTRQGGAIRPEISNQLADIEGYAQSMEMPRLQCEALHLRARILAQQGEQRLAGLLVSNSIAIATRNDLRLRKIASMSLYGRILISRGLHEQGKHVATSAMDLARRAGYQIIIEKSERALRSLPPGQMDHSVRARLNHKHGTRLK